MFFVRIDAAIIGGTGIGSRLAAMPGRPLAVSTRYGYLRGRVVEFEGIQVLAIQRHSAGHAVPPHLVNYRAIALGVAALRVKACFATAAVGSLRTEWPTGTVIAVTDFIDVSGRNLTLYDRSVKHTPFDAPFGGDSGFLWASWKGDPLPSRAVYLQANGPRYETHAEIAAYGELGADLVGMTAASEATVMREAGVHYECAAIVSNLAAGLAKEIDHGAVSASVEVHATTILSWLHGASKLAARK